MTPDSPFSADRNRRDFVKKSLAASIIAAQPTILAGLVRAQGGGVGGTTEPWETTAEPTPIWETTAPDFTSWDTTQMETSIPETTTPETTPYDPYVLVCTGAPSPLIDISDVSNAAYNVLTSPVHIRNPYKWSKFTLVFDGPSVGDYSFNTFDISITGDFVYDGVSANSSGSASQVVGFSETEVTYTPESDADIVDGNNGGRTFNMIVDLEEGKTKYAKAAVPGWQEPVEFPPDGWMTATITNILIMKEDLGWEFQVMLLSEAIEFQNSLNQ